MGIGEIVAFAAIKLVATGAKNLCDAGTANTANLIGKAAWKQGSQVAAAVATGADQGLTQAALEFAKMQAYDTQVIASEKAIAASIPAIPLPTP